MKTIFLITLLILNTFITNVHAEDAAWTYTGKTGADHWSTLDSNYQICSIGKEQSPINIETTQLQTKNSLQLDYHAAPLEIINDGITVLNIKGRKTIINDGHTLQLNFPEKGPKETIALAGTEYRLVQFHFHTPAENLLNGKQFPMEIHFVHQSKEGELAVIGVWVIPGKANASLEKILNNLPTEKKVLKTVKNINIEPTDFTPQKLTYYRFNGSLTTPPCNEQVSWIVMQTPIEASIEQIQKLREAIGQTNARPVQPLHQRHIYKSSL